MAVLVADSFLDMLPYELSVSLSVGLSFRNNFGFVIGFQIIALTLVLLSDIAKWPIVAGNLWILLFFSGGARLP